MPRGGVRELSRVRVERQAHGRRHLVARDVPAHAAQQLGRRGVVVGIRAERVAHLPHQHGGADAATGDVSDRDVDDAVAAPHDVVPVAADLEARATRLIAAEQLDAFDLGQVLRQQAALEAHRDGVLVLVAARPPERLCGLLGAPGGVLALLLVEAALVAEEQAERTDRARALHAQRGAVQRAHDAAASGVDLGILLPQLRLGLDRERAARLVGDGRRMCRDEIRGEAAAQLGASHGGDLEPQPILGLERDDREPVGVGRREHRGETRRDVGRDRRDAEGVREVAALTRARALAIGLAACAQEQPADQAEDDARRGGRQGELEEERAARSREDVRAGPVDDDRPARQRGRREGDEVVVPAIQPPGALEQADLALPQLARERGVRGPAGIVEHGATLAVQHREAAEAEIVRSGPEVELLDEQCAREDARDVPAGVVGGHCEHDDPSLRAARRDALAHERRVRRHHGPEVRTGRPRSDRARQMSCSRRGRCRCDRPSRRRLRTGRRSGAGLDGGTRASRPCPSRSPEAPRRSWRGSSARRCSTSRPSPPPARRARERP